MAKTIFITGASRGFGRIWAEAFLQRGDNVVAAVRNPEATAIALLSLVDSENPPLRLLLGKTVYPWVKYTYEERLKTWESWQDVSVAAHG